MKAQYVNSRTSLTDEVIIVLGMTHLLNSIYHNPWPLVSTERLRVCPSPLLLPERARGGPAMQATQADQT